MSVQKERRQSKRLSGREMPYGKKEADSGSTGLTNYMGDTKLDWDGDIGDAKRRCAPGPPFRASSPLGRSPAPPASLAAVSRLSSEA